MYWVQLDSACVCFEHGCMYVTLLLVATSSTTTAKQTLQEQVEAFLLPTSQSHGHKCQVRGRLMSHMLAMQRKQFKGES